MNISNSKVKTNTNIICTVCLMNKLMEVVVVVLLMKSLLQETSLNLLDGSVDHYLSNIIMHFYQYLNEYPYSIIED